MSDISISVGHVRLDFPGAPPFGDVAFSLSSGRITCLMGASGIGKSSILRRIAGLCPAARASLSVTDGRPLARRVACMEQDALLCPWRSALGNVTMGALLRGETQDVPRARDLLRLLGLGDAADKKPAALSGGMRQRVALARTLYEDRPVVLLDEPFASVDALARRRLQTEAGLHLREKCVLLVTHDPLEAARLSHDILILHDRPVRMTRLSDFPVRPPRPADDAGTARIAAMAAEILEREDAPGRIS